MPTLNTAATASVSVTAPNGYITVDCSSGASVDVSWISPGGVSGRRTVQNISEDVGPFADGTAVSLSCKSGTASYTEFSSAAVQSMVAPDGNLAEAAVASTSGTPGEVRKLSDGPNKGAALTWAIPDGRSTYAWCWQIYPLASYL